MLFVCKMCKMIIVTNVRWFCGLHIHGHLATWHSQLVPYFCIARVCVCVCVCDVFLKCLLLPLIGEIKMYISALNWQRYSSWLGFYYPTCFQGVSECCQ